jgi:uncharacterized membrane protein
MEQQESDKLLIKELNELRTVLDDVKKYWKMQTSMRWNFLRGIVYGLGFFFGSAIIATTLIYLLSHLGINGESSLGRMIEKIVESYNQK